MTDPAVCGKFLCRQLFSLLSYRIFAGDAMVFYGEKKDVSRKKRPQAVEKGHRKVAFFWYDGRK